MAALLLAVVRRRDERRRCLNPAPGSVAVNRVEVTKRQPKVHRQRD